MKNQGLRLMSHALTKNPQSVQVVFTDKSK